MRPAPTPTTLAWWKLILRDSLPLLGSTAVLLAALGVGLMILQG